MQLAIKLTFGLIR